MQWHDVVVGYFVYLAAVSWTRREFVRARLPTLTAAAAASVYRAAIRFGYVDRSLGPVLDIVVPSLVLLAGYWLSGLFFTRPDRRAEGWLQAVDRTLLTQSGLLDWFRRAPRFLTEYLELSYLLVYVAVPAGAVTLAIGGHQDQIARYWTVVLLAEFVCYGMLPWIQTRPPRVLETDIGPVNRTRLIQRLNHAIVNRASIQANTVPSGHAAGALATALVVGSTMPVAGAAFLVLAASIAVATVLGRYHYVIDTVLGVLVAATSSALAAS